MTKDEALKLALMALERSVATCFDQYAHQQVMRQPDYFINKAITDIKEALAHPEQYPQIAISPEIVGYVAPQRTWVGLDEEDDIDWEEGGNLKDLVKAIEAKLKDKNTRGQE